MIDLTEALRQFDATEANLKRLEDLWKEIEPLIPPSRVFDSTSPGLSRYTDLCRTFQRICEAVPPLDGRKLTCDLRSVEDIHDSRLGAMELGDPGYELKTERSIYQQGETLRDYRYKFAAARRELVREAMQSAIEKVDECLADMQPVEGDEDSSYATNVTHDDWRSLDERISQIDALRGSTIPTPRRWNDLHRHLHFRKRYDLLDIIQTDWPAAKESLRASMYGPDDPIPVDIEDLGQLVRAAPKGPVVTAMKWGAIDANEFERLIFNLLSQTEGYSNVDWKMHTNAPDRGCDISATRTISDSLGEYQVQHVIVQCKHHPKSGLNVKDLSSLLHEITAWEGPKVAEVIVATTGRFTADAIKFTKQRNEDLVAPRIRLWADSDLERMLSARPHLIGEFGLR